MIVSPALKSLVSATLLVGAAGLSVATLAQTPGEWKYTIATDGAGIPADMRVNFPTVSFKACLRAADFQSGRAFGLQTLASSQARCPTSDFARERAADGKADSVRFVYACDQGQTLAGKGEGRVSSKRFDVELKSVYTPAVSGVEQIKQSMNAVYVGDCAAKADSDLLEVSTK